MATVLLSVWALVVAAGDGWRRRIPNGLLLAAWVPGIAVFVVDDRGWLNETFSASVIGLLIPFLALLPGFLFRVLGGGDVKFAACCGWFLGPERGALMLLVMALGLGTFSLWVALRRRETSVQRRIAAGPAIALGFAVAMLPGILGA
ncbi:MAG: prepilin peptidase [Panacagrimonas sp.]